jgi:hypothetical protein
VCQMCLRWATRVLDTWNRVTDTATRCVRAYRCRKVVICGSEGLCAVVTHPAATSSWTHSEWNAVVRCARLSSRRENQ